ncbi:MAG: MBL fold metallo-hydrolase [Anaerolineales bacterium]
MFIKQFRVGGDRNFGYLVADPNTKKAAVIDPSYSAEKIADYAREHDHDIVYVFNTHGHADHANGNETMAVLTGVDALQWQDKDPRTGKKVVDGATFPLGDLEIEILHTPGHTPDSICLYVGDAVFTGDTLFVGKVGGTDLGQGAKAEYVSLHQKLMTLPEDTRVFPGHDYGTSPQSTIGEEKENNPFILRSDFSSFVDLKENWDDYKRQHGIA